MVEPTQLINVLEIASPIIGGISTFILAVLYLIQHRTLSKQSEILEEQQKISRFEQTPYLVGPYNMRYDEDSETLNFQLSNVWDGPAQGISVQMEILLPGDDFRKEELRLTSSRTDVGFMEPNTISPNEQEVPFAVDVSNLTIEVERSDETEDIMERPLSEYIETLQKEGTVNIRYVITYSDVFGESTDPFGRHYQINSATMGISTLNLEEHFKTLVLHNHKLNQDM